MSGRLARLVATVALLAVAAVACSGGGAITLQAEFPDVIDLVTQAKVQVADVDVGTITDIELTDDNTARVTMSVREGTGLPSEVEAVLRQTSLLGERFVELRPLNDSGEVAAGSVKRSRVVSDLEDVVETGNDLLSFVAADRLNAAVQAGAIAFGGQEQELANIIDDVEQFVGRFERDDDEILRLLDNLDRLVGTLAEQSDTNAAVLEDLARSSQALQEEDERLVSALSDLRELGAVGARILRDNRQEFDAFFRQLRTILDAITAIDGALQNLLTFLPRHNLHVPNGQFQEFVQLWTDAIVCGTDDEVEGDPTRDCTPPDPVRTRNANIPPADACDRNHEDCGYPEGIEPGTSNDPDEPDRHHQDPNDEGEDEEEVDP